MSPIVEGLLIVLGALITILLTLAVAQLNGVRADTKEFRADTKELRIDTIKIQQDFNNRLIELETEHQVLWSERRGRKIIQLDRASGDA